MRERWRAALLALTLAPSSVAAAQPPQDDLKRLTIEELMQIDVTTAARREQPIGTTAAAISVITSDDIRRSGATTIADALRLADGVHVARANNGAWRITARGLNGATPNKLLVMIDGRTVYSPLFAGVFWNIIDHVLEDIDRIEVIRGPGAALWGANAVNGVVNIITKHARDTQGALVHLAAGNEDRGIAEARYGGSAGTTSWRVHGKFAARDDQRFAGGDSSQDARQWGQGGFRVDGGAPDALGWMVTGEAFHSRESLPDRPDGEFTKLALQGRLAIPLERGSQVTLQSYYRRELRRVPQQLTHHIDTVDFDGQHTLSTRRHTVVWGGGVRVNWDETVGTALQLDPADRSYHVANLFAQDEIALVPDRVFTTLGLKYEHNAFSGGELQPNARARWLLSPGQMVWGALSRAVRRPTRLDNDIVVPGPGGIALIRGTGEFEAEELTAAEIGYRVQPSPAVSIDATAFWHDYDDLRSQDPPAVGLFPITLGNTLEGRARGLELAVNLQPVAWWRTHVGYTRLETDVGLQPGSRDMTGGASEANDPDHLFALRSSLDLPRNIELDAMLHAVGALPDPPVPAYAELTIRAAWRPSPRVELFVVGHDLLHDRHPEVGAPGPSRVEFERGVRTGLVVRVGP